MLYGTLVIPLILAVVDLLQIADSLECFTCTNARNISDCHVTTLCAADQNCYSRVDGNGSNALFSLGCRNIQQCSSTSSTVSPLSPGIVGRDISTTGIVGRAISTTGVLCDQCCSLSYCNKQLCSRANEVTTSTGDQCKDDADYNCQLVSSAFNICGDVLHAKKFCRKWCGLCNLVDGSWAEWASWSECDVTCGSGLRLRDRSCNNPKPAYGGIDCIGVTNETLNCTFDACPVNGYWSSWTSWGSCSKSCGVGHERKDRNCSNPPPGPDGNPCYGDSRDDRACFKQACADGSWSSWTTWSTCQVTCNGGLMTRTRSCDNPSPSDFGKSCVGTDKDVALCNNHPCNGNRTDGKWGPWTPWSTCSRTCNGGLQTRSRDCNNPTPSSNGKACTGNNEDVYLCNNHPCVVNHTDGSWSLWTPWSTCSSTCNGGLQTRSRVCGSPYSSPNGRTCTGNDKEVSMCNSHPCSAQQVYFTVIMPTGNLVNGVRPFFSMLSENVGGGYNPISAIFTCPISGLYSFSITFTQHSRHTTSCELLHNNNTVAVVATGSYGREQSASMSIFVSLIKGDMFYLGHCSYWNNVVRQNTVFTGALIRPS